MALGIAALGIVVACDSGAPKSSERVARRAEEQKLPRSNEDAGGALRAGEGGFDPNEALVGAHHLRWVSGDTSAARRALEAMISRSETPSPIKGRAVLELADLLELQGARREALSLLERARRMAIPGSELRLEAEKRRAAILSTTPLADVPGPAPGTFRIAVSARAAAVFRRAERLLVAFYRLVLRPRVETIDRARAAKRRALTRAVKAYERVISLGKSEAALAARCRIGAMYQHMAEALAFDRPPELLPAAARRLSRELREESASNLRKALVSYRAAIDMAGLSVRSTWLKLARREERTLARVLEPAASKEKRRNP